MRGRSIGGSSGVKEDMRSCAKIGYDSDVNGADVGELAESRVARQRSVHLRGILGPVGNFWRDIYEMVMLWVVCLNINGKRTYGVEEKINNIKLTTADKGERSN